MELQLKQKSNYLEKEKENLYFIMNRLIDGISLEEDYYQGRPPCPIKDIVKSLLIMSYHSWSYRRAYTDIKILYQGEIISTFPKRATLNKYMLNPSFHEKIKKLITLSALSFSDVEDTIIIDSTWFSQYQRVCGSHKRNVSQRVLKLPPLRKTRKLHIVCFKNSKMIVTARASLGTLHDNKMFLDMMEEIIKNKFNITCVIADSAYNAKDNFAFLEQHNIKNAFIDFKKNSVMRRSNSNLRKEMLEMFWNNKEEWKETYRYRVLIESLFSNLKVRGKFHYLRSKKGEAQDCEILLKALLNNLIILSKHYFTDSSSLSD